MKFISHTDYQQSLKLKELGMEQLLSGLDFDSGYNRDALWFEPQEESQTVHALVNYDTIKTPPVAGVVRALTRQEIEDYLMARHDLRVWSNRAVDGQKEYSGVDFWKHDFGCLKGFPSKTTDPFPALYDALVWSLEQERTQKQL